MDTKYLHPLILFFIIILSACDSRSSDDDETPAPKNWNNITWDNDNWS